MENEIEKKYDYLYNNKNILTHFSEAIRGDEYKMYINQPLDYIFKKGKIREYFSLKNDAVGSGESAEHYNAKMDIVYKKKYFDTIFQETVYFSKIIPEIFLLKNKKPDLSCYDENDNLVCIIEILYSNKKTTEDIEKLKSNKVALIEIDIKNDNKCEHLILPILLESNKGEYQTIENEIKELTVESKFKEEEIAKGFERKQKIAKYIKEYGDRPTYCSADSERIEKRSRIKNRIEQSINESREMEKSFREIAKNCKVEWFRNKWMTYKIDNKINDLIFWTS
jgi:DNA repair ATPase RecN